MEALHKWVPLVGSAIYVLWAAGSLVNEGRPWFALAIFCYAVANVALVVDSIQYGMK